MANRAIVAVDREGEPEDSWEIVTKDKPSASPGHVVVRLTLRPVNPTDLITVRIGLSHLAGKEVVTGSEGVGFVEEVGEGITKVKVGQRVVLSFFRQFYENGCGSWQDYVEMLEEEVFLIPDSIPDEVAAQFIVNPWTVYGLVKTQEVPKGEYLLQTGAASVLGRQVIQLCKHWGIKTINVVRRDDVKEELKELGADEVINSTTEDIVARVKEITGGKGAYGALDTVAGITTKSVVASVKDGGKVFVCGLMSSSDATVSVFDFGRVEIRWWSLGSFIKMEPPEEIFKNVAKLLDEKVITPLTGNTYKFEDFKLAVVEARKPSRGGKILMAS